MLLHYPPLRTHGGTELRSVFGKAVWGAVVALALCAPVAAAPRGAGDARAGAGGAQTHKKDKLDASLRANASSGAERPVIVTVKSGAKPGLRKRLESRGAKALSEHSIINALSVRVDAHGLAALLADPDVEYVSGDVDVASQGGGAKTSSVISNLKKTLALGNWFAGSSVTVALIDSGIAETPDFTGRIIGTYDFTNGQGGFAKAAVDEFGHGTHVAGLAGSSGAVSNGAYAGVAPGVKFLSLRVLDKKGTGKTSDVIAALQFAVANRARFGIRIINLSLGHPIYESATTDPLVQAVEAAARAGIVVVVAAGNYGTNPANGLPGYAGITSPGNAPSAITVGAASGANSVERHDDRVSAFSSRGPSWFDGYGKPDVVAPGEGLYSDGVEGSTLALTYPGLMSQGSNGKLMRLSGSSMATGVVTGLVAVMIEAHEYAAQARYNSLSKREKRATPYVAPVLTPNAIKAMLQYSATPLRDATGANYNVLTQGAGEVDGLGALILAYSADSSKAAGTTWMTAVTPTTTFGNSVETWSQQIVWGTRVVSGSGLVEVNQTAWAQSTTWGSGELDNIVWGTTDAEADNIVWGTAAELANVVWEGLVLEQDNIVWGTLSEWGVNLVWGTELVGVLEGDNIVWGTTEGEGDNIVWGTLTEGDNIVWGTVAYDSAVWGSNSKVMGFVLFRGIQ
jgi:serine protease AprX